MLERVFVCAEERLDDLFRGFVDFIHQRDFVEDFVAELDHLSEEKAAGDEAEEYGEDEEEDQNRDLAQNPNELLGDDGELMEDRRNDADEGLRQEADEEMDDPEGNCDRKERDEPGEKVLLHAFMMTRNALFRKH